MHLHHSWSGASSGKSGVNMSTPVHPVATPLVEREDDVDWVKRCILIEVNG